MVAVLRAMRRRAPYWRPGARGAVFGMTRNSGPAGFARAALESVGYQTRDLLEAMQADWAREGAQPSLRVDGGMAANDYAMQFLSDIIGAPVDRPQVLETTALGAAWLAGMRAGVWPGMDAFAKGWAVERQFTPAMEEGTRNALYDAWTRAVQVVLAAWGGGGGGDISRPEEVPARVTPGSPCPRSRARVVAVEIQGPVPRALFTRAPVDPLGAFPL